MGGVVARPPAALAPRRRPAAGGVARYLADLGALYRSEPALWAADPDPEGFAWIDATDADASVYAYLASTRRRGDGWPWS